MIFFRVFFSAVSGTLCGHDMGRYVLKLFNFGSVTSQVLKLESKLVLDCNSKLKEHFAVPVPIRARSEKNEVVEEKENVSYIGSFDLPLLENAVFEGCSKEELINKGLLQTTAEIVTCRHLTRLVVFIEGTVPEHIKNNNLIESWAKNTARMANFFKV